MLEFVIFGFPTCSDYDKVLSKQTQYEVIAQHTADPARAIAIANWLDSETIDLYNDQISERHELEGKDIKITQNNERNIDQGIKRFVMTDQKGKKLYCSWQTYYVFIQFTQQKGQIIYEPQTNIFLSFGKRESVVKYFYVPKKICLISAQPQFRLHKQVLELYSHSRRSQSVRTVLMSDYKAYNFENRNLNSTQTQDYEEEAYVVSSQLLFSLVMSTVQYYQASPYKAHSLIVQSQMRDIQILPTINSLYTPVMNMVSPHPPFQTFQKIILSILLEKQIIVFASETNKIVDLFQLFFEMIKPLEWNLPYIPVLPNNMFQVVDSFMPYIIGIDSRYKSDFMSDYDTLSKVIIDLDAGTVSIQQNQSDKFPQRIRCKIQQTYTKNCYDRVKLNDSFECRRQFIGIILQLCSKIRQGLSRDQNGMAILSLKQFLQKIPSQQIQFYENFTKTMMFSSFQQRFERSLNNIPGSTTQQKLVNEFVRLLFLKKNSCDAEIQDICSNFIVTKQQKLKRLYDKPARLSLYTNLISYIYRINNLEQPYLPYLTLLNIYEPHLKLHSKKRKPTSIVNLTKKLLVTKKYITHNPRPR